MEWIEIGFKVEYNWCKSQLHLINTSFKLIVLVAYGVNGDWCQGGVYPSYTWLTPVLNLLS